MPGRDDIGRVLGGGDPDPRFAGRTTSATTPTRRVGGLVSRNLSNPATRGGYALVASSAITSIIGVVFWWVGARWWAPDELGRGAALVAAMALVAELSTLGMAGGFVRFLPRAGQSSASLIGRTYAFTVAVALVLGVIAVLGLDAFASDVGRLGLGWSVWFVIACCAWCVFVLQDGALIGLGRATTVPVENLGFAVAKLAALVGLASFASGEALFLAWSAPTIAVVGVIALLIFRRYAPQAEGGDDASTLLSQAVRYSVVNYGASMVQRATPLLLPLIVISSRGAAANSYFYVAWTSAYALYLVSSNIGDSLVAEAARRPSRLAAYTGSSLGHSLIIVSIGAIGALIVAPWYLRLFGAEYSDNGASLLRLLAVAAVPNAVTTIYISVMRSERRMRRIAIVQAMVGLPTLALSVPVLDASGLTGLGVLWLVNQTAVAAVLVVAGFWSIWVPSISLGAVDLARRVVGRFVSVDRGVVHSSATAESGEILSNRHGLVVARGVDAAGENVVVKHATNGDAVGRLRRESVHLRAVHAAADADAAQCVPKVLDVELGRGEGTMVQQAMVGRSPAELTTPLALHVAERMGAIGASTATSTVVGDAEIAAWVTGPAAIVEPLLSDDARTKLDDLVAGLTASLAGERVVTSIVHGDLSADNVLVDATGALTAIVDWELAAHAEMPEIDMMQLMLGRRYAASRSELGTAVCDIVADGLNAEELAIIESAGAHPNTGVDWRTIVLLTWLRHVAANIEKSDQFAHHRVWRARNLAPVLATAHPRVGGERA